VGANGFAPSDVNFAVGPNHIVQMVNVRWAVFDKSGNLKAGPVTLGSIWSALGGICTSNGGDPVVQYDRFADRWLLSQIGALSGSRLYRAAPGPGRFDRPQSQSLRLCRGIITLEARPVWTFTEQRNPTSNVAARLGSRGGIREGSHPRTDQCEPEPIPRRLRLWEGGQNGSLPFGPQSAPASIEDGVQPRRGETAPGSGPVIGRLRRY
jgi:hypothetical protein